MVLDQYMYDLKITQVRMMTVYHIIFLESLYLSFYSIYISLVFNIKSF